MDKHVLSVKYSLFGSYDYIEATPENVSSLYNKFGAEGFIPNTVTLLKLIQPQYTVEQAMRPQLINKKDSCVITVLPERVDIEFSNGVSTEKYSQYMASMIDIFSLKISRIALNTSTEICNLTEEEILNFNMQLASPSNYDGENNLIEYSSRRVSRKKIASIDEMVNVGRNIVGLMAPSEGGLSINRIRVDTDINTLAENNRERFDLDNCEGFFEAATSINNDVINFIMVMKDED